MTSDGSVTCWIQSAQMGDGSAMSAIWDRYFVRLVGLARSKMRGAACRVADEEDIALNVLDSVCRGLEQGRFPNLENRDNLWKLLVVLTARKALRLVQRERFLTNGGGNVIAEADIPTGEEERALLDQIVSREPSPAFAVQVKEECDRLLDQLGDDTLRSIARWKLEGYTNAEIGVKLDRKERTVERKLQRIRECWGKVE